jgi:predicted phosphodiesterase
MAWSASQRPSWNSLTGFWGERRGDHRELERAACPSALGGKTLKMLVFSDIHFEREEPLTLPPDLEYDGVILAGDIRTPGHKAVHWARRESTFDGRPVIFVPGNHELYTCEMGVELEQMRAAAKGSNVHVLTRDRVVIDGVRFLGCTLWTDFQLPIRQANGLLVADVNRAMAEAEKHVYDFRSIERKIKSKKFRPARQERSLLEVDFALAMHWRDRDWLRLELEKPFAGPTVVVTHHAPALGSVAERYADDWVTPAFVSDLPAEFFDVPVLWVHGHTHSAFDYRRGNCRVLCNPRGYRTPSSAFENAAFDAGLVVEVAAAAAASSDANFRSEQTDATKDARYLSVAQTQALLRAGSRALKKRMAADDLVTVAEAAKLTGASRGTVNAWIRAGRCIGLRHAASTRLPKWQFDANCWPLISQLSKALRSTEGWELLSFLESPHDALGGVTPRAAIEQGHGSRVIEIARHEGL